MHHLFKISPPSSFMIMVAYLGLNLLSSVTAALMIFFFPGISPLFLFFPSIILVTWYAGFLPGIFTTIISLLSIIILLFIPYFKTLIVINTNFIVELCLFFAVGSLVSYVINKSKHQDTIIGYQKKLRQTTHLIETLEKNYENAQKEIKARDQFLAIASHELKTPVTSMLLQMQNAIHSIRNVSLANFSVADLLKMLEGTEQQSRRLSRMVNDLLNLSLITTGRLELEKEDTDLSKVVRDVEGRFSAKLQRENILVEITADKPVIGKWDKVRIEQAVTNLISNAIKYGAKKPITISVSNSNNRAKLLVQDQGIGISSDHQKRIFERFERAVSPKTYQGLGVGLYITNQIIKAHNGKISVQSRLQQGTNFIIELPLHVK